VYLFSAEEFVFTAITHFILMSLKIFATQPLFAIGGMSIAYESLTLAVRAVQGNGDH